MGDFMAHHHRHRIGVFRDIEQPGVDRHLAAGQTEGIGLIGLDHIDVPIEGFPHPVGPVAGVRRHLRFHFRHFGDQALGDFAHLLRDLRIGVDRPFFRQDVLVGLQAHGFFLVDGNAAVDQHFFAGVRVDLPVGNPVIRGVAREQQQNDEARVDAAPALSAVALLLPVAERVLPHRSILATKSL
jgi:hypothetical protein